MLKRPDDSFFRMDSNGLEDTIIGSDIALDNEEENEDDDSFDLKQAFGVIPPAPIIRENEQRYIDRIVTSDCTFGDLFDTHHFQEDGGELPLNIRDYLHSNLNEYYIGLYDTPPNFSSVYNRFDNQLVLNQREYSEINNFHQINRELVEKIEALSNMAEDVIDDDDDDFI